MPRPATSDEQRVRPPVHEHEPPERPPEQLRQLHLSLRGHISTVVLQKTSRVRVEAGVLICAPMLLAWSASHGAARLNTPDNHHADAGARASAIAMVDLSQAVANY